MDRLERARQYLVIAESNDSKREAYRAAAEEIAAAKVENPKLTNVDVATSVGRREHYVRTLLKWRDSGYEAETPWLMKNGNGIKATDRAALSHSRKVLNTTPKALAPEIARALEDPEVAQAVSEHASQQALSNVDIAAGTESYMRKRATQKQPPAGAASHKLGGIGPGAMADEIHRNSLEPRIDRVYNALTSLKTHVGIRGAHLSLTSVDEFDELDRQVEAMGELFAFMLDSIDAAKRAKLANEAEGVAS